jgi:ubiquinone/menaquinone biosynthesis C-methylase UbiE
MNNNDHMNKYNRTADLDIYINQSYKNPKEMFKQVASLIDIKNKGNETSILDIGCATGAFLYYLRTLNKDLNLQGVEYSSDFVKKSEEYLKTHDIKVTTGDANNLSNFKPAQFDVVTTLGVTSIFDDFRPSFDEMIRVSKNGAQCINATIVNELPIDVIIKYINPSTNEIESGWNKFSKQSISNYLESKKEVENFEFIKHVMPFDMPEGDDKMRNWTVLNDKGERILWNGLNMEISIYFIVFRIKKS